MAVVSSNLADPAEIIYINICRFTEVAKRSAPVMRWVTYAGSNPVIGTRKIIIEKENSLNPYGGLLVVVTSIWLTLWGVGLVARTPVLGTGNFPGSSPGLPTR